MTKDFEKAWKEGLDKQIRLFFLLCSKTDFDFFDNPEKRTAEGFVRLMYIALLLGFNKFAINIVDNADTDFEQTLNRIGNDNDRIVKWMDDFIESAPESVLKQLAEESWNKMKKDMEKNNRTVKEEISYISRIHGKKD